MTNKYWFKILPQYIQADIAFEVNIRVVYLIVKESDWFRNYYFYFLKDY